MILNIRGTNGSGKSYVARHFLQAGRWPALEVKLCDFIVDPAVKKDEPVMTAAPPKVKALKGYHQADTNTVVIGSYHTGAGGMDTYPSFAACFEAIEAAKRAYPGAHIVCEGILASTVVGAWGAYAASEPRGSFAFAYLQTSLEDCLARIRARQIAAKGKPREIKANQVADKIQAIAKTRVRLFTAGFPVYDLPHDNPQLAAEAILKGEGQQWKVTKI